MSTQQSTQWTRKITKVSVLLAGALMTMGNQKCEQKPQASTRVLRKIVELSAIRSSPVMFPGGSSFDFQFVANQQIYGVLMDSKEFTLRYAPPISMPPQQATTGDDKFLGLEDIDGPS